MSFRARDTHPARAVLWCEKMSETWTDMLHQFAGFSWGGAEKVLRLLSH